MHKPNSFIM